MPMVKSILTQPSVVEKILLSMNGMLARNYSFRIRAQEVAMALSEWVNTLFTLGLTPKSSVKIADDQVQVDPHLLLQRLVIACDYPQLEELFQCELYTYHSSFRFPIHVKAATKVSTSRCTMDKAYTRGQDAT